MFKKIFKRIIFILGLIALPLILLSCDSFPRKSMPGEDVVLEELRETSFEVVFVGLHDLYKVGANEGDYIEEPVFEDLNFNAINYWVDNLGNKVNFPYEVRKSDTFYGIYDTDYEKMINQLSKTMIRSTVRVFNYSYNRGFFSEQTDVISSAGSGVVFYEDVNYFYVLSNEHVVNSNGRKFSEYEILDYKGNIYNAEIFISSDSAIYDLVVLKVRKKINNNILVANLSLKDSMVGDGVISVGYPNGQANTITLGRVLGYSKIFFKEGDSLEFHVLKHNAPISKGSSGGVLFDFELNITGINFAGSFDGDEFVEGSAIQVSKIREYLEVIEFYFNL